MRCEHAPILLFGHLHPRQSLARRVGAQLVLDDLRLDRAAAGLGLDARDSHEDIDRGALKLAELVADELRFLGGDLPGLGGETVVAEPRAFRGPRDSVRLTWRSR